MDLLRLCLNRYSERPAWLDDFGEKVSVVFGDNQKGSAEKFHFDFSCGSSSYHLTIDDDIIYPCDYVERMVRKSQQWGDAAVIGVHGSILVEEPRSYFRDRVVFSFGQALKSDTFCHLLGTGTILFNPATIRISYEDMRTRNMDDIWFAVAAQQRRVPMLCIAREAGWLRVNPKLQGRDELTSVYMLGRLDDSEHTRVVNQLSWQRYGLAQDMQEPVPVVLDRFPEEIDERTKNSAASQGFSSGAYWESRYASGRDSGAGSRGELASFKAEIVNDFVSDHAIATVIELGCGDGQQLRLLKCDHYLGYDVSPTALKKCREIFKDDPRKKFDMIANYSGTRAELALSLDVLFHLVEEHVFQAYMQALFAAATRYVIIYSSNRSEPESGQAPHVRHRRFTEWVEKNRPQWRLVRCIPNRFPFEGGGHGGSFSDFYIYERNQ